MPAPAGHHRISMPAARIVLDTNVWLDLLLFRDPRTTLLAASLRDGRVVAVVNAECRAEWLQVLGYPRLQLDEDRRAGLAQAFDSLAQLLPDAALAREPALLPRCADCDDQKFLQLAFASGARW